MAGVYVDPARKIRRGRGRCAGHNNAVGLRPYFNGVARAAKLEDVISIR